jgi:hypothetical protein
MTTSGAKATASDAVDSPAKAAQSAIWTLFGFACTLLPESGHEAKQLGPAASRRAGDGALVAQPRRETEEDVFAGDLDILALVEAELRKA